MISTYVAVLLSLAWCADAGSNILWDRIFGEPGGVQFPQDCVKRWGPCYYHGSGGATSASFGSYFRQENVVIPEANGGSCNLMVQRYCDDSCQIQPPCRNANVPKDCVKKWGPCIVFDGSSYRLEEEVEPAENGGACELRYEFGCGGPPQDCVKRWGSCSGVGAASFRDEIIVTPASNGGRECTLKREFGCNQRAPIDCTKRWGPCNGVGPSSLRREIVVSPAQYGGKCVLRVERGCNPNKPVDCTKKWGECFGEGSSSFREEMVIVPAKFGGVCNLRREFDCNPYKPVNCKKRWGQCKGFGASSSRTQVIVSPAMHGGRCNLRTQTSCNKQQPVDCTKEWGECIGDGPSSFRDEVKVMAEKFGGECELGRQFGCNPYKPVNCKKRWGPCRDVGPQSEQKQVVVDPAEHGGRCVLRTRKGCNPFKPVDCTKKWGDCTGVGPLSTRREVVVTKARNGGKCVLRTERGCNDPKIPVECLKKWGECVGKGPTSFRDQEVVVDAENGGECVIEREFGCNKAVDCVKKWGPCITRGDFSYRMETIDVEAQDGGEQCSNFQTEIGCVAADLDDTKGKKIGSLLLENFFMASTEGDQPVTAGQRSLVPIPGIFGGDASPEKNCTEIKDGNVTLAVGCDDVDIDQDVVTEESKLPTRSGEKKPVFLSSRRKRNTSPGESKPRDVLFYLDSSRSVGKDRFETMKEVSKAIIDSLCGSIALGKYQTRVAMATFNARQLLSFPFTTTSSRVQVKGMIDRVPFDRDYSYSSCIKKALEYVLTGIYLEKNGARDPSYAEGDMFILTDGCANCDFGGDDKEFQRMAYRLKLNKVNVYAIGIGLQENCKNILKVLARGGRCFHFFFLDDWDVDIDDFLYRLKNPSQDRCLPQWEFPELNCLERANQS